MKGQSAATQMARETEPLRLVAAEEILDRTNQVYDSIARRAYEIFENSGRVFGRDVDHWLQAESELVHPLHLDICESEEAVTVRAEVPGFRAKDLELSVEPRRLTITGKRESRAGREKRETVYRESCSQEIFRVIELPAEVAAENVTATLRDGILELEMPKAAAG